MKRINLTVIALCAMVLASCGTQERPAVEQEPTVSEQAIGSYAGRVLMFEDASARREFNESLAAIETKLGSKDGLSEEKLKEREATFNTERSALEQKLVRHSYETVLKIESTPSEIRGKSSEDILAQLKREDEAAASSEKELAKDGLTDEEKAEVSKIRVLRNIARQSGTEHRALALSTLPGFEFNRRIADELSFIGSFPVYAPIILTGVNENPVVALLNETLQGNFDISDSRFVMRNVSLEGDRLIARTFDRYLSVDRDQIEAAEYAALPMKDGFGQMELTRQIEKTDSKDEQPVVEAPVENDGDAAVKKDAVEEVTKTVHEAQKAVWDSVKRMF